MADDIADIDVIEAMGTYGGSFVHAIARAWQAADAQNRERLKVAFPDLWRNYRELIDARARRLAEGQP